MIMFGLKLKIEDSSNFMKIAVVGSRSFRNYDLMKNILNEYNISLIISGGAYGADRYAERYADEHGLKTLIFYPEWEKYGKQAGYIRNKLIVENADLVVAFWDGISKGTKHTIDYSIKIEKRLRIINF